MDKKVIRFLSIVLGLVFIFSSMVKAVDPLGTVYKLDDYFVILNLRGFIHLDLFFAILLISIEFLTGVSLVFGIFPRLGLIAAAGLLIVFTPLTLYLAIKNPITDCGCFGDAIKLSNWQTFAKNIVFDTFVVVLAVNWDKLKPALKKKWQFVGLAVAVAFVLGFQWYNLTYLPLVDFRPFKVGVDIKAQMKKAGVRKFKTVLIYKNKKTGQIKEFNENNFPWNDTNWVWVQTKSILIKAKDNSEIQEFVLTDSLGNDLTDSVLNIKKPVFLIIAYDLSRTSKRGFVKLIKFYRQHADQFYQKPICITASSLSDIKHFCSQVKCCSNVEFLFADATMLKTVVRANPGAVILQNGVIKAKSSFHSNLNKKLLP